MSETLEAKTFAASWRRAVGGRTMSNPTEGWTGRRTYREGFRPTASNYPEVNRWSELLPTTFGEAPWDDCIRLSGS